MATEAQKRASTAYNRENTTLVTLRLNHRTDADILAELERQDSKAGYIKRLIREDMGREGRLVMSNYVLTGKVIDGNYIDAPLASGKLVDSPVVGKRVVVELDGVAYERTIYHRVRWANLVTHRKTLATFVIIDGTNYEVKPS